MLSDHEVFAFGQAVLRFFVTPPEGDSQVFLAIKATRALLKARVRVVLDIRHGSPRAMAVAEDGNSMLLPAASAEAAARAAASVALPGGAARTVRGVTVLGPKEAWLELASVKEADSG